MNAVDRADMCRLQMQQLFESVRGFCPYCGAEIVERIELEKEEDFTDWVVVVPS